MIKFNYLIFSLLLSLTIHIIFIYQIQKQNEIEEIYVLDLTSFKEFKPRKIEVKEPVKKQIEIPEKKIEEKKIIEEKIPIKEKQVEIIKPLKKIEEIKSFDKNKKPERKKKVEEVFEKNNDINFNQKKTLQNDTNKKLLVDQKIKSFLLQISNEINKIAIKSYPIQSIKRREQGTIVAIVILNADGDLLELKFENRRPKRLYQKTKQILKSYKFPKPPTAIFENSEKFILKIPVNYILK